MPIYIRIALLVLGLLMIPFVAMFFSKEVHWSPMDFILMGCLLYTMFYSMYWVNNRFKGKKQRILYLATTLVVFLIIWAELAVGIFGTPFAGN